MAVALAIVDVLALIFVVAPLRASQQARAHTADLTAQLTRSTVDPALILPTRDPRKPWGTRTPAADDHALADPHGDTRTGGACDADADQRASARPCAGRP